MRNAVTPESCCDMVSLEVVGIAQKHDRSTQLVTLSGTRKLARTSTTVHCGLLVGEGSSSGENRESNVGVPRLLATPSS